MKNFLFLLTILSSLALLSCGDSGTGPDPGNDNENGNGDETYTVSVDATPSDAGSVSPSGENTYEEGEEIELQATPNEGYIFTEWTGEIESDDNPLTMTVDKNINLTANFSPKRYDLSILTKGEGYVTPEPNQANYEYGQKVQLNANSEGNWYFKKWEGDTTGTSNPITITINSNKTITGVFFNDLYEGGVGTEDMPFEIATAEQLQHIQQNLNAHYIQIKDIDASETKSWDSNQGFMPIGYKNISANESFKGSYNGKNFKISNLYINRPSAGYDIGLFGNISHGTLENIVLENVNIKGDRTVAGLVGSIGNPYESKSFIKNAHVSGDIYGESSVGGLASGGTNLQIENSTTAVSITSLKGGAGGLMAGTGSDVTITQSTASGTITAQTYGGEITIEKPNGGLIGGCNNSTIINSYSTGNINGERLLGGLIGKSDGCKIQQSYATGDVSGYYTIGGLVGRSLGDEISTSYSTGNITGIHDLGGLVGESQSNIINSYALGDVKGGGSAINGSKIGGLVGWNRTSSSSISTSFSAGNVSGQLEVGGLVGHNNGSIESSYWDKDSSNQINGVGEGNSEGVNGLSTSKMTGTSAKTNMSSFNWAEIWITTDSYPALFWE